VRIISAAPETSAAGLPADKSRRALDRGRRARPLNDLTAGEGAEGDFERMPKRGHFSQVKRDRRPKL